MDTESLFRQSRGRPITFQESHNELLEAYDALMGFETYPCGVGMSREEDPLEGSLLSIWYETYAREQVWDTYHLDFDAFLDRPRYEIFIMLKNIKKINLIRQRAADGAGSDLEKQQRLLEAAHRAKT